MLRELLEKKNQIEAKLRELTEPLQANLAEINQQIEKKTLDLLQNLNNPGTYHLKSADGVKIKVIITKTVKWDQKRLLGIRNLISATGDDPGQYMRVKYKVSENAYKNWPEQIKSVFLPARTVIPSKPKFEFTVYENDTGAPF